MKHIITKKQHNSKMCFVCGMKNNFGLKTFFYETDTRQLVAIFKPREEHQSYPGRLHGGVAATILDETIGRAILMNHNEEVWGITIELKTNFLKPIPLNEELKVIGRIVKDDSRFFEGTGELVLCSGEVAVTAEGRYLKVPLHKIANFDRDANEWKIIPSADDPVSIDL